MKKRVRFGLDLKFPFGMFKNAGVFVFYTTEAEMFAEHVDGIRSLLILSGRGEIASLIVFEVA